MFFVPSEGKTAAELTREEKSDSIVGLHGDEVKVAITAPPVDGQANSHLTKFLGKQFRVAKS
ncbi:DUF167 family protein, partial [Salmonella enterica subsp. enterica serovar Give]|nr:DUF167 family protein [Salmonella enterica subsp. enterica serovar Give]